MNQRLPGALRFLGYTLDPANARLSGVGRPIDLRPKSMALLAYLVTRPGQLLTKEELLAAVWPDTAVSDWVLTTCIRELRAALGDDSRRPRIIQTVHRRGYRFIAEVGESSASAPGLAEAEQRAPSPRPALVGREAELEELSSWLREATARRRQIGFVAGEAGMGKTALVDAFVEASLAGDPAPWIARGGCIEPHGPGEPYLPVLDALGRLFASGSAALLLPLLRRHAPSWLLQLPAVLEEHEIESLERRLGASGRQRMLREMAAFVEALPQPLLLVLDDLHWCDHATLDLLAVFAQRQEPAPLCVIGTYRPVEVAVSEHPLKRMHYELRAHSRCRDLWLQPLAEPALAEYLQGRWPGLEDVDAVARSVHRRTDGNPLFLVSVADALASDGEVVPTAAGFRLQSAGDALGSGLPSGLREMIASQSERLSESDRELLRRGSLVGRRFPAALVAATLDGDVLAVEERLAWLARRGQLIRAAGESRWPDATVAGCYEFIHVLYQVVLRDDVPPAARRSHHARIAERLEQAHAGRPGDVAAELAHHFEAAEQPDRAIRYLARAAERAARVGAAREAVARLRHGIALLDALPETPERTRRSIRLLIDLGRALPALQGYVRPDAELAFERARVLSEGIEDRGGQVGSLIGLASTWFARARFDRANEAVAGMSRLAEQMPVPMLEFAVHVFEGLLRYHVGSLADARLHFEAATAMSELRLPTFSIDPRITVLAYLASTLLHQGLPDQARARLREAADQSAANGRPFERANLLEIECNVALLLRDYAALATIAEEARIFGADHDVSTTAAVGSVGCGLCAVLGGETEQGLALLRSGIEAYRSNGHGLWLAFLLGTLAFALAESGDPKGALLPLAEARALIEATREQRVGAELFRLEGVVRGRLGDAEAEERWLARAVETARAQGARWLELRATVSLADFARREAGAGADARRRARDALARQLESIREGHDTADLRAARALLHALS